MLKKFLILVAVAAVLPISAQARDLTKAQIITSNERPTQCISPIAVYKIDGQEVNVNRMGFEIEPGVHSLNGRAALNMSYCKALRGNPRLDIEDLEAEFEAGKTYYIGYDHSGNNRKDWKLVVWKTEEG